MTDAHQSYKIIAFKIENIKRISLVEARPNGAPIVHVKGRNASGKTSLLDGLAMALWGQNVAKKLIDSPLRKGARSGSITVEVPGFIIERKVTKSGRSSLSVTNTATDQPISSPQEWLSKLIGPISYDPTEFLRLKPVAQREMLLRLIGIDLDAFESRRKEAYARRTGVNRRVEDLRGVLKSLPNHGDGPTEETSIKALLEQQRSALARARDKELAETRVTSTRNDIRRGEERLAELEERAKALAREITTTQAKLLELRSAAAAAEAAAAAIKPPDMTEIERSISGLEADNRKARERASRASVTSQLTELEDQADRLNEEIAGIDGEKVKALEAAKMPTPGLGFAEDCVTLNGMPLMDASSAEQIRTSIAICSASNPDFPICFIREGSLLDSEQKAVIAQMASERDAQFFIEEVNDGDMTIVFDEPPTDDVEAGSTPDQDGNPWD